MTKKNNKIDSSYNFINNCNKECAELPIDIIGCHKNDATI
jgi:hypothetical protein